MTDFAAYVEQTAQRFASMGSPISPAAQKAILASYQSGETLGPLVQELSGSDFTVPGGSGLVLWGGNITLQSNNGVEGASLRAQALAQAFANATDSYTLQQTEAGGILSQSGSTIIDAFNKINNQLDPKIN